MAAKYHIKQCAIEFRVELAEFASAIRHYEEVFGVSHHKTDQPELVVLQSYEKKKRRFYVGIRAMAAGSTVLGPVVYWFTDSNIQEAYEAGLAGRPPMAEDEPPTADTHGHYRSSVIDAYNNRFGSINPDYPIAPAVSQELPPET